MNEITVRDSVTKTSADFDALMRAHAGLDQLAVHLAGDRFYSVASDCWGDTNDIQQNAGFRAGRNWTFDSDTGATLVWDVDNVPDERVDDTPKFLIQSTEARFDSRLNLHTPQEVWDLQPRGQAVRRLNFDLQYSKAVDRWKAKGKKLEIGAVALGGHQFAIEKVDVANYGALGHEAFPLYGQGAYGMYDRNLIAELDPATHIFDDGVPDDQCSHMTDITLNGYAAADTDDQVSCAFIAGSVGQRSDGQWIQNYRAFAYARNVAGTITDPRPNRVQLITIYQSLRALVDGCYSDGMSVGYYGDTYSSKGVDLRSSHFLRCHYHGVHLQLSPGGPCPEQCSHEDFSIDGTNTITSEMENVRLNTLAEEYRGPPTDQRYIRRIAVDAKFSFKNDGATEVTRTGVDVKALESKGGCGPLRFFRR